MTTDRYGYLQGKQFAVELLQSCRETMKLPGGIQEIIENLERALDNKPPAHAAGIKFVIEQLRSSISLQKVKS